MMAGRSPDRSEVAKAARRQGAEGKQAGGLRPPIEAVKR